MSVVDMGITLPSSICAKDSYLLREVPMNLFKPVEAS